VTFVVFELSGGGSWLKTSHGGRGLAENVRILSYREEGSKIAQKTLYDI